MRKESRHESPAISISPGRLMTMIKNLIRSRVILFMAVAASGCRSNETPAPQVAPQTAVGDAALTAEEVGVYADFIDSFAKTKFKFLHAAHFLLICLESQRMQPAFRAWTLKALLRRGILVIYSAQGRSVVSQSVCSTRTRNSLR